MHPPTPLEFSSFTNRWGGGGLAAFSLLRCLASFVSLSSGLSAAYQYARLTLAEIARQRRRRPRGAHVLSFLASRKSHRAERLSGGQKTTGSRRHIVNRNPSTAKSARRKSLLRTTDVNALKE